MLTIKQALHVHHLSLGISGSDQYSISVVVVLMPNVAAGRSDASGGNHEKARTGSLITGSPQMAGLEEAVKCYREHIEA